MLSEDEFKALLGLTIKKMRYKKNFPAKSWLSKATSIIQRLI